MSRFFLAALAVLFGLIVAGIVVVGLFPPHPHRQPVEHVVPNDRFKP